MIEIFHHRIKVISHNNFALICNDSPAKRFTLGIFCTSKHSEFSSGVFNEADN